jgi:hypothetical protein
MRDNEIYFDKFKNFYYTNGFYFRNLEDAKNFIWEKDKNVIIKYSFETHEEKIKRLRAERTSKIKEILE